MTSVTFWGESTAEPMTVSIQTGAILIAVQPRLGAERFRVYLAPAGTEPDLMPLVAEIPTANFSGIPISTNVSSMAPPNGTFPQMLPQVDTTAHEVPAAISEAVRLLAVESLGSDFSSATAGIIADQDQRFAAPSTSGKPSATSVKVAELLRPYRYRAIM